MKIMIQHIKLIEHIDYLVRLNATGTPEQLAGRLHISKTKLYRLIEVMRTLNAPILYDCTQQSFVYEESVGFRFGFYRHEEVGMSC